MRNYDTVDFEIRIADIRIHGYVDQCDNLDSF